MNIGIFVNSKTGNTLSVAETLRKRLLAEGHEVSLEKLFPTNESEMDPKKVRLKSQPLTDGYDLLIFAAPVNGFRPSITMQAFLLGLPELEGRQTACFVTQGFPFPWMGGNQALAIMRVLIERKGGKMGAAGVINWKSPGKRAKQISELVEMFAAFCR